MVHDNALVIDPLGFSLGCTRVGLLVWLLVVLGLVGFLVSLFKG
jgi:hypothetical protein